MAIVFRAAARYFPQPDPVVIPYVAGGMFLVVYFLHRYHLEGDEFGLLLPSLLRSVLAYHIIVGVVAILVATASWLRSRLDHWKSELRWQVIRWRDRLINAKSRIRRWWRRRYPLPLPPPRPLPPPVSRAVRLRRHAQAVQADYEAEVAALEGLPLDEDEREVLLCAAKQRLISKLNPEG